MCVPSQRGSTQQRQNNDSPQVRDIKQSLGLSQQEMQIVNYHNETIAQGKVGKDKFGRPVTVYSIGIKIPPGEPNAGLFVSVPGYNRETREKMTEQKAYNYWKKEIQAGKWPIYSSGTALNKRSEDIHKIMNMQATQAIRAMR
tara:strand:- start:1009 stop:1437 length:429 start_codon:yes stop_codon:yes gene_type:complete